MCFLIWVANGNNIYDKKELEFFKIQNSLKIIQIISMAIALDIIYTIEMY